MLYVRLDSTNIIIITIIIITTMICELSAAMLWNIPFFYIKIH